MVIRNILKTITKSEWRLVLLFSVFIIIITGLPFIYSYIVTPQDHYYSGIHVLTPGDFYVYYSFIEQVKQGHWLLKDLYTSEYQTYYIISPWWLIVGLGARIFNLSSALAFQLSRLLLIPIFIASAYVVISFFFENKVKRKICLTFLLLASGMGGHLILLFSYITYHYYGYWHYPMDLWVPESITFLTLLHSSHHILSILLVILILWLMFLAFEYRRIKYAISSGLLGLFLFWFHPFHILTVFAVIITYMFVMMIVDRQHIWSKIRSVIYFTLPCAPAILYYLALMKYDDISIQKAVQNVCLTPVFWIGLVSYGFLILLALSGAFHLIKKRILDHKYIFIIVWLVTQFWMIYAPVAFQRRLTAGLHFPITLLAIIGLFALINWVKAKVSPSKYRLFYGNPALWLILFVLLFCFSNVIIYASEWRLSALHDYIYVDQKYEGIIWLKDNTSREAVILSGWDNGTRIPGISGRTVYLGHGVETIYMNEKMDQLEWFLKDNQEAKEKYQFLKQNGVDYLFYTEDEKKLGTFNPASHDFLTEVYRNDKVVIYEVE